MTNFSLSIRDVISSAQTAILLVGFVWANDKSFSLLVQFVQFIFEVVWSSC